MPIIGQFDEDSVSISSLQTTNEVDRQFASTTSIDDKPSAGSLPSDKSADNNLNTRLDQRQSLETPGQNLPTAPYHRAPIIVTARGDHPIGTQSSVRLLEDHDRRRVIDAMNDTLFFPWVRPHCNTGISQSLPVGHLHATTSFTFDQSSDDGLNDGSQLSIKNVASASPTTAHAGTKPIAIGKAGSSFRGTARSPKKSMSSGVGDSQRRQFPSSPRHNGEMAPGSLKSKHQHGSSIFGSKMFESMSSLTSISSQHVHVVAESVGVDPILSQYSVDDSANEYSDDHVRNIDLLSAPSFSSVIRDENVNLIAQVIIKSETVGPDDGHLDEELLDNATDRAQATDVPSAVAVKRKWHHQIMPDLVEGPEGNTLTAQASDRKNLATAALALIRGDYRSHEAKEAAKLTETKIPETIFDERAEQRRYMKNLIIISMSFFFIFMAYMAIRNLQSSLNAGGGLGLYALSSVYAGLFTGSFFTTTIVQRLGPKRALTLSMLSFISYNAANFYPRFYTLLPMSVVVGFCLAVLWTAHATYLTNIAVGYAKLTNAQTTNVLGRFNGIFFAFFQVAQIAGGLITSLLLTSSSSTNTSLNLAGTNQTNLTEFMFTDVWYGNQSMDIDANISGIKLNRCGSSYCPSQGSPTKQVKNAPDPTIVLILLGIFLVSTVTGVVILVLFLDPLEGIMAKKRASFKHQMTAVFRLFRDRHVVCLGFSFYSLLQSSFMFGEFTKVNTVFYTL